jgi:hypothetical protein
VRPTRRYSTVPATGPRTGPPPARTFVSTISEHDASLLDVVDSLLNKGVVLNADVILALADVDLVYLRLSALLCAADRMADETLRTARPSGKQTRSAPRRKRAARKA